MALYVLAFTDGPILRADGDSFHNVEIDGIVAICRRRNVRPPATDDVLRRQHREIVEIAGRTRAILPVRFGALVQKDELVERVRSHEEVIRRALDDVRDRVQMTLRILGRAPAAEPVHGLSGRQYLEQRQRALEPVLPPDTRALVEAVRPLAVRERIEPGAAGLLATIYHLVPAVHTFGYASAARKRSSSNIIVSGPWPPFAFTPELW